MPDVLEIDDRDPLAGYSPQAFGAELERRLAGRVKAAYFFGSFDTPAFHRHSDIDLILVTETDEPFVERGHRFSDLRDLSPAIEVLVYTPEEFERLIQDPSPGFWRGVVATLRRLT